MDAPREVRLALYLSSPVLVIEAVERLWRISVSPDSNTFTRLRLVWTGATLACAALVVLFIFLAARRSKRGRVGLLIATFGGWCLWYFWTRHVTEYVWWQWIVLAGATAAELFALVLLFHGNGAAWYRCEQPGLSGG